ncbi:MAG TPA: hypothetical protein VEZ55_15795 [Chitinophagaceae bacterium]|jgi:hypothetical protein|nr:hypothetical protein [Chitinophagaceae bacterium]
MSNSNELMYVIPARYRKMENMHIIFWLLKDVAWCMIWKLLGIVMIFPTLIISIIIAWRTREIKSELAHNLAITFWISANSYWMISEFFGFDETLFAGIEGKYFAIFPFGIGVLVLVYYYLFEKIKGAKEAQVATM